MSRLWLIAAALTVCALLATATLWVRTRRGCEYIGLSLDYRQRIGPDNSNVGRQSFGLFAFQGRIGILNDIQTVVGLDREEYPQFPPKPASLFWDTSDEPDTGLHGDISGNDLDYDIAFSHLGLSVYQGEDSGMRHHLVLRGVLLDTWLVLLILTALLALSLGKRRKLGRRARNISRGLCPICAYDLRAHRDSAAGKVCPECGAAIEVSHTSSVS